MFLKGPWVMFHFQIGNIGYVFDFLCLYRRRYYKMHDVVHFLLTCSSCIKHCCTTFYLFRFWPRLMTNIKGCQKFEQDRATLPTPAPCRGSCTALNRTFSCWSHKYSNIHNAKKCFRIHWPHGRITTTSCSQNCSVQLHGINLETLLVPCSCHHFASSWK